MIYDFFSLTLALFLLMDSLGNVPLFISLLKPFPETQKKRIVFRELCIALALLLVFFFVGAKILQFIHIQQHTIFMGGGIILFTIALRMLFPTSQDKAKDLSLEEPLIVPLAIPLVAGPASLAAVMIYAQKELSTLLVIGAILLAWALSTLILMSSSFLHKLLKDRGMKALERIMGFLLILLAIQMFLDGCSFYIHQE
ncbi:MAG: NAAT family transporter, partial [Chlamydiae bacterium]|nr:NAAT family transporter [Chlamydiota bacterium]